MVRTQTKIHDTINFIVLTGTSNCQDGGIRLIGGEMEREGRVEMCFNGVWGAVCANGWDDITANITCSQLGYSLGNHTFILSGLSITNRRTFLIYHSLSKVLHKLGILHLFSIT